MSRYQNIRLVRADMATILFRLLKYCDEEGDYFLMILDSVTADVACINDTQTNEE